MPEALYSLKLTRFAFPPKLGGNRANFRFLATVRYVAPKGKLATESVVLPGLDVYWECDPKRPIAGRGIGGDYRIEFEVVSA